MMASPLPTTRATRTLLVLTGVALLVNYVETMVIPGVPKIQSDFGTTANVASWITSAYLIVGSAVAPLFGKLGDVYGRKRMFLVSLSFYMVGVAMAGFSPTIYFLIFARALQGVGIAILPLGLAIITQVFPRDKIATAQGVISGTFAIGAAAGLIFGSYVVQSLGWQYAFYTALAASATLFAASTKLLQRDSPSGSSKSVDYVGAGTLMSGISLLLVYITEGPSLGWLGQEELAFLLSGILLTSLFFLYESRKSSPLIQLGLLRVRNVLVANLMGILSGIALFLLFFAVVYYTQLPSGFGLGLGIADSGWTLAPSALGMLVGGAVIGKFIRKSGPRPALVLGAALSAVGLAMLILARTTAYFVAIDSAVALTGIEFLIVPIVNMIAISLPRETTAVGLGMNTMLRNIGGALGPVVATTLMTTYTDSVTYATQGHEVVVALPSTTAFNLIFGLGIALAAIAFLISLATKNYVFGKSSKFSAPAGEVKEP